MEPEDSYRKLIVMVDEQLMSGKTKAEVSDILVRAGVPADKVDGVIEIVLRSRTSNARRLAKFFGLSIISAALLVPVSGYLVGSQRVVELLMPLVVLLLLSGTAFAVLSIWKSKNVLTARCLAGWAMYFSSSYISGIMFIHPGWDTGSRFLSGQGSPAALVARIFHHFGPESVAWAMLILSALMLMSVWAVCHEWRTGEKL